MDKYKGNVINIMKCVKRKRGGGGYQSFYKLPNNLAAQK